MMNDCKLADQREAVTYGCLIVGTVTGPYSTLLFLRENVMLESFLSVVMVCLMTDTVTFSV